MRLEEEEGQMRSAIERELALAKGRLEGCIERLLEAQREVEEAEAQVFVLEEEVRMQREYLDREEVDG